MENLTEKLKSQPEEILALLKFITALAGEFNYPVYIVGGFVRDLILGVEDFDLDIVIEGDGIHFAKELSHRLKADFIKHRRFQTATIVIKAQTHHQGKFFGSGTKIDIATARKEIYEQPASLPRVSPGTIKDDLGRRDFSINAMALSISAGSFGQLVDFHNSREDLRNKRIRVLHCLSFIDDPTRILRIIRFEQRFNFKLEKNTLRLLKESAGLKMLQKVHKHRLRDELILIFKEPQAVRCIRRVYDLCGFEFIHQGLRLSGPMLAMLKKANGIHMWFKDNFPHKRRLELRVLYLSVLLEGLSYTLLRKVLTDFAFHKSESRIVLSYKSDTQRVRLKLKAAVRPSSIYKILEPLRYEVIILILAKTSEARIKNKLKDFLRLYNGMRIFTSGHELKELGVKPGPDFKEILKTLLYAKLDKKFHTKEEELSYLQDKILSKRISW